MVTFAETLDCGCWTNASAAAAEARQFGDDRHTADLSPNEARSVVEEPGKLQGGVVHARARGDHVGHHLAMAARTNDHHSHRVTVPVNSSAVA